MKFELIVAFLSIFQIYHQAVSSALVLLNYGLTSFELGIVSVSFLVGKFVGTLVVVPVYKNFTNKHCLDFNAHFLFAGACLMLVPR